VLHAAPRDGPVERASALHIAVVVPVFRDWPSFAQLLDRLERALAGEAVSLSIVAVNDSPETEATIRFAPPGSGTIARIEILHLIRNLGHQRAIAVGLAYVEATLECDCVAVMDADGEDRPEDLGRLIRAARIDPGPIIVAERRRRSEGMLFRCCYRLYKGAFRLLTGQTVDFGNFCLIPRRFLIHLVSMSEIWSNFPAGILQSRLPIKRLPTERGTRYHGRSKMNLIGLIVHGLGAISVFSDAVFVRVTLLSSTFLVLTGVSILTVLGLKATGHATPGWASNLSVSLSVLAVQMVMLSIVAAFMVLNNRTSTTVIPRLNYRNFLLRHEIVWSRPAADAARAIA